jgi:carboxymethylenebutenolidase
MASQWLTIPVDGEPMWAYMSLPDSPGPNPAVVVAQHGAGAGVDDWVQDMTRRLAAAGYVAIAPHLFHREDPSAGNDPPSSRVSRLRDAQIIQDVNATIELIRRHPAVQGDRIGITGFCMGGRVAYLMATANPLIKAAGVFYGGNILVPWGPAPTPLDRTSSITCPVIGFFGADDANPTPADVEKIAAELTRHGKVHRFYSYPDTGHSFQWNGTPAYRAHASRDSWDKLLDWFQQYLRS